MWIFGPAASPTISAVTRYLPSSAGSLMTLPSSTTSTAGRLTLAPISPDSLSTVRTSSTDAFSCLPPQHTTAYTESSLLFVLARARFQLESGLLAIAHYAIGPRGRQILYMRRP